MNVRINAKDYADKNFVTEIIQKGKKTEAKTIKLEEEILKIVNERIGA